MSDGTERTVVFVKQNCPFCLKLRLYLLEAGLLERVELREGRGEAELDGMRAELAPHVEKVSFPTARFADGSHLADSDAIIARFEAEGGAKRDTLPTFGAYLEGPFATLRTLREENAALKRASASTA